MLQYDFISHLLLEIKSTHHGRKMKSNVKAIGKFITIEGVEGVGKTTNIEHLKEFLSENKIDFIVTREPGGTQLGEKLRDLLLAVSDESVDPTAELLLVFAARAQHVAKVIKPALAAGRWVLCDRFTDATFAYQGAGRGIDLDSISALQSLVHQELRPDLTLILDLDPAIGMQRAAKRASLDRFEQEQVEFFERVRASYLRIARSEPSRCAVINADQPVADVKSELIQTLREKLRF